MPVNLSRHASFPAQLLVRKILHLEDRDCQRQVAWISKYRRVALDITISCDFTRTRYTSCDLTRAGGESGDFTRLILRDFILPMGQLAPRFGRFTVRTCLYTRQLRGPRYFR